jgi:hypothetical protein
MRFAGGSLLCTSIVGAFVFVSPSIAAAQSAPVLPGRFSLAAAARWTGHTNIAEKQATETAPNGGRFQLFNTNSSLAPAVGVEARLGVRLTRLFEVEGSAAFARPSLETRVSGDAEGASNLTIAESVSEVSIGGTLIAHMTGLRFGVKTIPFVSVGGGLIRDLHDTGTLAENGQWYHVGGGIHYVIKSSAAGGINAVGIRADGRAEFRSGGVMFDDRAHVAPSLGVSLFARF